jgi:hypothetical protein
MLGTGELLLPLRVLHTKAPAGVYQKRSDDADWMDIFNGDAEPGPTNPLLLRIDKEDEWLSADLRIMIFGQETNDWEKQPDKSMEHLYGVYDRFFNKGECWSYGGAFWRGVSRFTDILAKKFPDRQTRYVWNNIVKVGKCEEKGRPPINIQEAEDEYFHVIPDEVKILKPNIILFLTGPKYDDAIRKNFGELEYAGIPPYTERQLAKISIPETDFAGRTYHPNYLWRNDINAYFNAIVNEIK